MRIVRFAVLLLLAAACSRTVKVESDPDRGRVDVDVQRPGTPEGWSAVLRSVNASGVTGEGSARDMDNASHVTVRIAGA
ncbi:MAG TPA: hypothetical protein VFX98_16455, partial [Longimicrobiaceae bacterium]|nr:hypothetical protein [Longimicrobiaceae bacterium]